MQPRDLGSNLHMGRLIEGVIAGRNKVQSYKGGVKRNDHAGLTLETIPDDIFVKGSGFMGRPVEPRVYEPGCLIAAESLGRDPS